MTKQSLLIIGPGYIGAETARRAAASGTKVYALVRTPEKAAALEASRIIPLRGDLTQPESLPASFPESARVLFSAAPDGHTEDDYRRVYLEGLKEVLKRLRGAGKILWVSSTSVWGETRTGWVDETVVPFPGEVKPSVLLESEKTVLASGIPSVVVRFAGIYGPERNRLKAFREGRWPEAAAPLRYLNLIHREDCVRAIQFLFEQGQAGEVYAGADPEPPVNREMAEWLLERVPRSEPLPEWSPGEPLGKRVSSLKLQKLGFVFQYPSFREGYKALLEAGEGAL